MIMNNTESYDTFEKVGKNYKRSAILQHLQSWKEKPLHGQFLQDISSQICVKSQWLWLRFKTFSRFSEEMEGIIFAALEQALSTNAIKTHIAYCVEKALRLPFIFICVSNAPYETEKEDCARSI